jgi:hypothetical protein
LIEGLIKAHEDDAEQDICTPLIMVALFSDDPL